MTADLPNELILLRDRIEGPVLAPGDLDFADELASYNLAMVHAPDLVVGVASEADVVEAVRFVREHHLAVRVHATGHGAPALVSDGILLSTHRLDSLEVDPDERVATFGAGVRWGAIVAAAAEHGLAPISGSSATVGAVGLLLGGGLGPLARSHGFASDYARGFRVVTGTGDLVDATATVNADLFWALRGGKGGLGVVTEVRLELAPLSTLYAGSLMFAEEHIEAVLRTWVDWTATAADDVTTSIVIIRFPPMEFIPEPMRGRTLLSLRFAFPGPSDEGERLAAPLRACAPVYLDGLGELAAAQIATIHNDPADPSSSWVRGLLLTHVDQDFAGAFLGQFGAGVQVPMVAAEVRQLGGRTRVDVEGGSAVGGRAGSYTFGMVAVGSPAMFETVVPAVGDRVFAALAPWTSAETNINLTGELTSAAQFASAWPADIRERLEQVRAKFDPDGVFPFGL